jgi:cell division septation protein DedD
MAKPKMSTRRPKSVLDQDRYTAELSTGQLVIGVCILLMFGLGCFLLGVLIGKFDPTLKNEIARSEPSDQPKGGAPEVKIAEPVVSRSSPSASAATAEPVLPPEMRAPARFLAANSAPLTSAAPPPVPAVETALPAEGESVQAAAERNRVSPPSAQPQAVAAPATASAAVPVKKEGAAPATPAPKPTPPAAGSSEGWKGYGVQVVAVARDRADAALKNLQAKSSYKGRVLAHARGDLFRVVVGPYADQAAALKARDDLRARGYKDAFVLVLQ